MTYVAITLAALVLPVFATALSRAAAAAKNHRRA